MENYVVVWAPRVQLAGVIVEMGQISRRSIKAEIPSAYEMRNVFQSPIIIQDVGKNLTTLKSV